MKNYPRVYRKEDEFRGGEPAKFINNWEKLSMKVRQKPTSFQVETLKYGLNVNDYLKKGGILANELPNAKSADKYPDFVSNGLTNWLRQKVIVEIEEAEALKGVINPLTVAVDDSNPPQPKRLCLHTLHCNNKTKKLPMKLPSVTEVAGLTNRNVMLAKFDLKSGFLHIPLMIMCMKLFIMKWRGRYYKFITMPWGTSFATAVFQRFQQLIVAHLQQQRLICFNYIDDLLVVIREDAGWRPRAVITYVLDLFLSLGYFVSSKKCSVEAERNLVFLGIGIDPINQKFYIMEEKRQKLIRLATEIATGQSVTVKQIQKWSGFMMSLSLIIPTAASWLGPAYNAIKNKSEHELIKLSPQMTEAVKRWKKKTNIPTEASWKPESRTCLNWWVARNDCEFWAETEKGDAITPIEYFPFFIQRIAITTGYNCEHVHLFTRDASIASISDPKCQDDNILLFRSEMLRLSKRKITFHLQTEEYYEEGLAVEAAKMLDFRFNGKIMIDLMASSFNNYGDKVGRPLLEYREWKTKCLFEYKEEWDGYALLFPPEKWLKRP